MPHEKLHPIVLLARDLVRLPTAIDHASGKLAAIKRIEKEFSDLDVRIDTLTDKKEVVGLVITPQGHFNGYYCLAACGDTAPVGDLKAWDSVDPFSGLIENEWLYGRGSADSKLGLAIYISVFKKLVSGEKFGETAPMLFVDFHEHSGEFLGAKKFLENEWPVLGLFIGYPGDSSINIGARGVSRYEVSFRGKGGHSGSSEPMANTVVSAMLQFVETLQSEFSEIENNYEFDLPPKLSVTDIQALGHFTTSPAYGWIGIDFRKVPGLEETSCRQLVRHAAKVARSKANQSVKVRMQSLLDWPAYKLKLDEPIVSALSRAAEAHFASAPKRKVVGPSNVGNLLAGYGIPTICGYGVRYENMHAPFERADISQVGKFEDVYLAALRSLLSHADHVSGKEVFVSAVDI